MGYFLAIPILSLAAVLQATLLPRLNLIGTGPNLAYIIVIAWALRAPLQQAVFWALVGGITGDLLSAQPLGTSPLGLALIVFVVNLLSEQFADLRIVALLLVGLFGTLAYELYRVMMLDAYHLLGMIEASAPFRITWGDDITTRIGPMMLYNVALVLPTYLLLRQIQRKLPAEDN